jgi:hypothetical protein
MVFSSSARLRNALTVITNSTDFLSAGLNFVEATGLRCSNVKVYALILVILLSGPALVVVARNSDYAHNLPPSPGMIRMPNVNSGEYYLNVENTRVRYVEAGAGSVIVMIHGNASSVDDFDFKEFGYVVSQITGSFAVDRPGHGRQE